MDIRATNPNVIMASIEVGPSGGTGAGVNEDGSLTVPGQGSRRRWWRRTRRSEPPARSKEVGIWRSDDGARPGTSSPRGDRWMYYSKGRSDPTNPQIAIRRRTFLKRPTAARTWQTVTGVGHSDHHAIWVNPRDNNHILLGNDGGLDHLVRPGRNVGRHRADALGQFYAISADMQKPYVVCGGCRTTQTGAGRFDAARTMASSIRLYNVGGGMASTPRRTRTTGRWSYSESQDGNTNRRDIRTGRGSSIRPRGAQAGGRGGAPNIPAGVTLTREQAQLAQLNHGQRRAAGASRHHFRFFWSTPFILSPHNPRTVYLGAERLFRSYDRGDTWMASPDLTRNIGRNDRPIMGVAGNAPMASQHDGAASYSNIVTVSESYVVPGILWVGTNDGNVR